MGYGLGGNGRRGPSKRARALLAQEIRNARGGHYTFTRPGDGRRHLGDEFEQASWPTSPAGWCCSASATRTRTRGTWTSWRRRSSGRRSAKAETFEVDRFLGSTAPGANFPIGNGLGVAVVVEKKTPGKLTASGRSGVQIHGVTLDFVPKVRDENNVA